MNLIYAPQYATWRARPDTAICAPCDLSPPIEAHFGRLGLKGATWRSKFRGLHVECRQVSTFRNGVPVQSKAVQLAVLNWMNGNFAKAHGCRSIPTLVIDWILETLVTALYNEYKTDTNSWYGD